MVKEAQIDRIRDQFPLHDFDKPVDVRDLQQQVHGLLSVLRLDDPACHGLLDEVVGRAAVRRKRPVPGPPRHLCFYFRFQLFYFSRR